MMQNKILLEKNKNVYCLFAAILGALSFVVIYGTKILNPAYVDWLLTGGDLTQHYMGWVFFRKGDWTFPFGLTNQLAYPSYTSVIYTDSIPIFAVFFKMFSSLLPDKFQYFGIWGVMCFMLQSLFTYLILDELEIGKINGLIACLFFVFSPAALAKMFKHTALGGHWIILLAIYIFVRHKKDYDNILKSSIFWALVALLISSIHMYYLPMCGMFLIGYIFSSLFIENRIKLRYFMPLISFMIVLFFNTYLLGGFSSSAGFSADGLGEGSFNLNGFFGNKGYSRWLPSLPKKFNLQYEGFSYIGMGMIFLLILSVLILIITVSSGINNFKIKQLSREYVAYLISYLCICIGLVILAASPVVTFGDHILFTYPDIDIIMKLWSIFRASGRLIWPVMYLIFIGLLFWIQKNRVFKNNKFIICLLLISSVSLQLFDMGLKLKDMHEYYRQDIKYSSEFDGELWEKLSEYNNLKHVVWVPNDYENNEILNLSIWADKNNCTMNKYYFARGIDVRENTIYSMDNLNDECIYIFKNTDTDLMNQYDLHYYQDDRYTVGLYFELENP